MADRYPLIVDSSSENIKELPTGDAILFLDNEKIKVGTGSDLTLYHDASNSYITNAVGALKVATETSGIAVTIGHTTSETTVGDNLTVTGDFSVGGNFDVTGTLDFSDSAISNVGDISLDSISGDADANTSITFSGSDVITIATGGSGRLTIGDGALSPVTDNQIDLGTSSLEFKDAFFDGTVTSDAFAGPLTGAVTGNASTATLATTTTVTDSTANTNFPVVFHNESNGLLDDTGALRYNPSTGQLLVPNLTVAGTTTTVDTVTMEASNAIIFEGATADEYETTLSIVDPTADHTQYLINQGGYIPVLAAATTTAISSTPAELNLLDGSVANTVVNSKAVIYGGSGEVAGTLSTAAQGSVTSLGTLTTLTVDNVIINGSTIGHTGDTDLMTVASGALTVAGSIDATNLTISSAQGSDGQLLTSTGSGVAWETSSAATTGKAIAMAIVFG